MQTPTEPSGATQPSSISSRAENPQMHHSARTVWLSRLAVACVLIWPALEVADCFAQRGGGSRGGGGERGGGASRGGGGASHGGGASRGGGERGGSSRGGGQWSRGAEGATHASGRHQGAGHQGAGTQSAGGWRGGGESKPQVSQQGGAPRGGQPFSGGGIPHGQRESFSHLPGVRVDGGSTHRGSANVAGAYRGGTNVAGGYRGGAGYSGGGSYPGGYGQSLWSLALGLGGYGSGGYGFGGYGGYYGGGSGIPFGSSLFRGSYCDYYQPRSYYGAYGTNYAAPRVVAPNYAAAGGSSANGAVVPAAGAAAEFQRRAEQAFREHRYDEAARLSHHAIVEDNQNGKLYLFASQALFALGEYQAASAAIQQAAALLDRSEWGFVVENYRRIYRGPDYVTQMARLVEFIEKNPEAAYAYFLRGYHYVYLGHEEAARKQLSKALELESRDRLAAELLTLVGGTPPAAAEPSALIPPEVEKRILPGEDS
jgi:hypothetical protein